jgi:hypothetical protein
MSKATELRDKRIAAIEAAKNRICETCGEHIINARLKQMAHDGKCDLIRDRKRKRERNARIRAARIPTSKICPCGNKFETTNPKKIMCGDRQCKNAYQRAKAKAAYDELSELEKKALRQKKYRSDRPAREVYRKGKHKVTAKCPKCEDDHTTIVHCVEKPTRKPRIFCDKCKRALSGVSDLMPRFRTAFGTMQEYHTI